MTREQKLGILGFVLAVAFSVSPIFQNCAKVNYGTKSNEDPTGLALASRKIMIDTTTEKASAPVKILFIVDDSYTMSQSQQLLSNSIDSLLNPLKGRNVTIKVVSTSGVPNNAIDYSSDVKYFNELQQEITASQTAGLANFYIEKRYYNINGRHSEYKILPNDSDLNFSNTRAALKNTLLNMGTNGSDQEEGLCAIARQLFDTSSTAFFKAGDKGLVILISDENDASVFDRCTYKVREKMSSQDVALYNYNQQQVRLKLEVRNTQDGLEQWLPVEWGVSLSGQTAISVNANCSTEHKNYGVNKITALGYQVRNVSSCVYEVVAAAFNGKDLGDDASNPATNLCTQSLMFNNVSYSDLYQMVNSTGYSVQAGSCQRTIQPGNTAKTLEENAFVTLADSTATTAKSLPLAIYNRASTLFGQNSFFLSAIVHKNPESCSLSSGQSYGTKYEELSRSFPDQSVVTSICDSNYGPALGQLSSYVIDVVTKSYQADISSEEKIIAVVVLRGSESIRLGTGDYEAAGGTITFLNFQLQVGDKIEAYISQK